MRTFYQDGKEIELLPFIFQHPSLPSLRNKPEEILSLIEEFDRTHKKLITIGHARGELIKGVIAERKPATMVEFGGYVGYSAIKFGDALRKAGGKKYYSLEIDPIFAAISNLLLDLAGLRDVVQILVAPAQVSLARLIKEGLVNEIEILFLDHWKDRYLPDLRLVESLGLLKPERSILVADNVPRLVESPYLTWIKASPEEKKEIQKDLTPPKAGELRKLIEEKEEKELETELSDVAGNPDIVYETVVHDFQSGARLVSYE